MRTTALSFTVAIIAASLLHVMPAQAQSNRTFVSGRGADTGGCALTAPCRSFSYAITVTNAGGEIVVLTSAGYGTVTINKAISISNEEGVEAAVTVTSGDGITVAAGSSDVVNLRGLTLIGQGTNGNGIIYQRRHAEHPELGDYWLHQWQGAQSHPERVEPDQCR